MTVSTLYQNRAVVFNPNNYPNGWNNNDAVNDFVKKVIAECYHFLPEDWVVLWDRCYLDEVKPKIIVGLKRYEKSMNLQPTWHILPTQYPIEKLHPIEEGRTREWVEFNVKIREANKFYGYQLP